MEQVENKVEEPKEVIQPQNTTVVDNQQAEIKKEETAQDRNWRLFREQREQERKQKEEAERLAAQKAQEAEALKAAMDALLNKNQKVDIGEEDSEENAIEKKVEAILIAKERQLEEQRRLKEQQEFPQRLVKTFNDFDKVCTSENLDYLEYHYPEVAEPFKHLPDSFDKWAAVYKAVKRFVPNTDSRKDHVRAEKNFNKPQSASVGGVTQTGDTAPQFLDQKRKDDNWARMQKTMKGIG